MYCKSGQMYSMATYLDSILQILPPLMIMMLHMLATELNNHASNYLGMKNSTMTFKAVNFKKDESSIKMVKIKELWQYVKRSKCMETNQR